MRISCLFFFVFVSSICNAQDIESERAIDSIGLVHKSKIHFYIAPSFSINQFVGTVASFAGVNVGIHYREHLDIGIKYSAILNNFQQQIIFPAHHHYEQTNIGLQVHYSFFDGKIRPIAGIGIQLCNASWQPESDSEDTFTDYIYTFEGKIGLAWLVNKNFELQTTTGYNVARDVEIVGIKPGDYDGFTADLVLKIKIGR